jgi:hypothetical protein
MNIPKTIEITPYSAIYILPNGRLVDKRHDGCSKSRFLFPHPCIQDVWCIPLQTGRISLIDTESVSLCLGRNWSEHPEGYVVENSGFGTNPHPKKLHRVVMPSGKIIDHIDGNPRDNRRQNLRPVTAAQNCMNRKKSKTCRSKYKGVTQRSPGRWRARININRKAIEIGNFSSEEDAGRAYNEAALNLFGEYARLNVIE